MDEVELARTMKNLRVLVDATTEPDNVYAHMNIKNALLTIMTVLYGLNERITEMQSEDEC